MIDAADTLKGGDSPTPIERHRAAVRYSIHGDLRFISHQDTLRLWTRALVRAQLPLRYSQGMNPHPRISLPLPRSVGVASEDEWLLIELTKPIEPEEICRRLTEQVPDGLTVLTSRAVQPIEHWMPTGVIYHLPLPEGGRPNAELKARIEQLLQPDRLLVQRVTDQGRTTKTLDIRPLICALRADDCALELELIVRPEGAAKPAEVLEALGLEPAEHLSRLVRQRILWAQPGPP
jgi:radical SAM-linked protein